MMIARGPSVARLRRAFLVLMLPGALGVASVASAQGTDGAGTAPVLQRGSLLPLVQPLWSELTPAQQRELAPFAQQWNAWPLEEKRAWVRLADRLPKLPADQQARARARIAEWAALSPEQRRLARQNFRLARQLPAERRVQQWQRYDTMTPEQKEVLRAAGATSNTAAGHAGARTALAKEAARPMASPVGAVRPPAPGTPPAGNAR